MIRLAIVSINRNKFSETFIHNHVRRLPADIHYMTGGYLPVEVSLGWDGPVRPLQQAKRKSGIFGKSVPVPDLPSAIISYLRQEKIQAVLAEYGPSGVEMLPLCKESGIPLVVHFHGYDAYRNDMLAAYGDRYQELFQGAQAIIAVSRHMKRHLISLGAPEHKVHWIPCGPDEILFRPVSPAQSPPHFLAVGRFAETKSPHLTLLAFARVLKEIPEARLTFCGGGHLEQACKILAEALKISQNVDFKGVIPHAKLPLQMARARAFVQHSVTTPENDIEGTPVSIQEASLSGLPVVSTRHAGIPDVIKDGESGLLVAEKDIEGMAKAMIKLGNEPQLAEEMGKKGRIFIEENFTLKIHLEKLWKIIENTL